MGRKHFRLGVLAISFTVAGGAFYYVNRDQGSTSDVWRGPSPGAFIPAAIRRSFALVEERQDRFSKRETFIKDDRILRLETIADLDPDSAATLMREGALGIQALYANALSDYPDDLSQKVATPPRFRPVFVETVSGEVPRAYFLLYATDRLTVGAASDDTATKRALLGWVYCKDDQALYRIEVFAPRETEPKDLEDFFLTLSCQ